MLFKFIDDLFTIISIFVFSVFVFALIVLAFVFAPTITAIILGLVLLGYFAQIFSTVIDAFLKKSEPPKILQARNPTIRRFQEKFWRATSEDELRSLGRKIKQRFLKGNDKSI